MNFQGRERWGSIMLLALVAGFAAAALGCNVLAGLDDVKFD